MSQPEKDKEIQILFALYGATVEQMEMLSGEHKHLVKNLFNKWKKQGQKYFDAVEKYSESNNIAEDYENAKDIIHDGINVLRKQLT